MPRSARIVHPGAPHHVIQRGNRQQRVFHTDADYAFYRGLLAHACRRDAVTCWAWCLMPNHVHLVLMPEDEGGLARAVGRTHRLYSAEYNRHAGMRGHVWEGRFRSSPMDERHLAHGCRYIELNPVRAGLVSRPEDWPWSSCRTHLSGQDDDLVTVRPMFDRVGDWAAYLAAIDPYA